MDLDVLREGSEGYELSAATASLDLLLEQLQILGLPHADFGHLLERRGPNVLSHRLQHRLLLRRERRDRPEIERHLVQREARALW